MNIAFVTRDLLFTSRVEGVARQQNVNLLVVTDVPQLLLQASEVRLDMVLLDRTTSGLDPAVAVSELRSHLQPPRTIIAFGPHVHERKLAAARETGCDQVLSRGEFNKHLDEFLAVGCQDLDQRRQHHKETRA